MLGHIISHYEILEKLGEGGMGVVYKAEDTKLGRHVVLKFLAPYLTRDSQAIERFINEAKTASALDHPNICTIYEIDESHEGQLFIAMGYYEGETLKQQVGNGKLHVAKVIEIAVQIAQGLSRAHEAGIIHRDVKPANIMITKREEVKILDFGLAKLAGQQHLTKSGATMGTIAYMSPEQAQGLLVDHRTDIWSLGVVMYEMLTGQLPFKGEYDQAMMYSIVNKDAESLVSLRSNLSMGLERVVAKMMAKDPAARYQHVDELPVDLRAIEKDSLGKSRLSPKRSAVATATSKRAWLAWGVAAFMTLVATITLGWLIILPSPPERFISRSLILPPENTSFNADHGIHFAISPDGSRIALVAADFDGVTSLWVRTLGTLTATLLNGTEGASFPFWSPDGRTLGFFSGGNLKKIAAAGGPALTICDAPNGRGGTWNEDGVILFAPSEAGALFKVAASGGTPIQATTLDRARGEIIHRWPYFLPDGKHFIFSAHSITSTGIGDTIKLGILERPMSTALQPAEMNAVYASGHLIFLQERTLMVRPLDRARLKFTAEATPIAENMQYRAEPMIGKANFSVSQNGVMVLQAGNANLDRFAFFDRIGNRLTVLPEQAVFGARLSPDGKLVAFPRADAQSRFDVWVRDLSRRSASRLTFDPAIDSRPVWSPDGHSIVFSSTRRRGHRDLFIRSIDDTEDGQLLLETELNKFATDWSRDGKYIAFISDTRTNNGVNVDLWLLPLFGKRQPVVVLQTKFDETFARFSPDARWLVYQSDETGRTEIYIRALDGSGWKYQVSTGGGRVPVWPSEGNEIFFSPPDNKVMVAEVKFTAGKVVTGAPRALFDLESQGIVLRSVEDVSRDGKTILARINEPPEIFPLTLVINWDAELKR